MFTPNDLNKTLEEARKTLETLGHRAQTELRTLLDESGKSTRAYAGTLGQEIEKLGKKLQEFAARPVEPTPAAPPAEPHA